MKKFQKVKKGRSKFFSKIRRLYCAKKFSIPFDSAKLEETW